MTDHDRGAYTPQTDAPLSFDARRAPGGRPLPMTLMISGMVLVILLIGVVYFYRSGIRQANEAPQVVGAPVGVTKAPAPSGEQPSDATAGLQVYKSEAAPLSQARPAPQAAVPAAAPPAPSRTAPKFTAAPEQPAPRPAAKVTSAPAPVQVAAAPATPPIQAAPAKPVSASVKAPAKAAAQPAVKAAPPAPAATPAPAGGAMVQIGAFSSSALADKGWSDVAQIAPGAMTGKTKTVQVVQKDDKTFYRTSVGGFASKAAAASFCATLKAAGKNCIVK
jgi:cell division protein FtsN